MIKVTFDEPVITDNRCVTNTGYYKCRGCDSLEVKPWNDGWMTFYLCDKHSKDLKKDEKKEKI